MPDTNGKNVGRIVEIKGVVIDAVFTDGLPEIYPRSTSSFPRRATARRST